MSELIFLFATLVLLGAFFALTSWEAARGARLFAGARARFDENVAHAAFVAKNVHWGVYANERLNALALWAGHEIAHVTLRSVRFAERSLSKAVRQMRARTESTSVPGESTRPFVQALSDFKEELKSSRPDNIDEPPQ